MKKEELVKLLVDTSEKKENMSIASQYINDIRFDIEFEYRTQCQTNILTLSVIVYDDSSDYDFVILGDPRISTVPFENFIETFI